jgi:hypothetical protein
MESPLVRWEQLPLGFKTSVCVPELGRQQKAAKCFRAATIDFGWAGICRTRQHGIRVVLYKKLIIKQKNNSGWSQ